MLEPYGYVKRVAISRNFGKAQITRYDQNGKRFMGSWLMSVKNRGPTTENGSPMSEPSRAAPR